MKINLDYNLYNDLYYKLGNILVKFHKSYFILFAYGSNLLDKLFTYLGIYFNLGKEQNPFIIILINKFGLFFGILISYFIGYIIIYYGFKYFKNEIDFRMFGLFSGLIFTFFGWLSWIFF